MQLARMFSKDKYKGEKNYLRNQKKFELLRTVLYFAVSLSLFLSGWQMTGDRMNLLTVVAVLGCLPASKSAVETIIFFRCPGCSAAAAQEIPRHTGSLADAYDMAFTSYEKNYYVAHLAVRGNTVCGYTEDAKFEEKAFYNHLDGLLKKDGFRDVTVKIFTDLGKYTARLEQLQQLETDESPTQGILNTLKSVTL